MRASVHTVTLATQCLLADITCAFGARTAGSDCPWADARATRGEDTRRTGRVATAMKLGRRNVLHTATPPHRHPRSLRARLAVSLGATGVLAAEPSRWGSCRRHWGHHDHQRLAPIEVTVLSPGSGDNSGIAGAGFVVDLSLDANSPAYNSLLSPGAGYVRS